MMAKRKSRDYYERLGYSGDQLDLLTLGPKEYAEKRERDYLKKLDHMSDEQVDREMQVRKRNKKLSHAFWGAAVVGGLIAVINTPVRFGQMIDVPLYSDFIRNNDFLKYVSNYVKGAGQAMFYIGIANACLDMAVTENKEKKHRKKEGWNKTELSKDYSVRVGATCIVGGAAWETLSMFGTNIGHVFDTTDMAWIVIGTALTIAWNKLSQAHIDRQFPDLMTSTAKIKPVGQNPGKISLTPSA